MKKRHNKLAKVVRRAIGNFVADDLRSAIEEAEQERLSGGMQRMRPDMIFERRRIEPVGEPSFDIEGQVEELRNEERITEIIEFPCPYGRISCGRDTLGEAYEEKKMTYAELARSLKRLRREEGQVTALIVSSMGAVYNQSLIDLEKVLGRTDRRSQKLGRTMSDAVTRGSM
jgi:hypothetical protein